MKILLYGPPGSGKSVIGEHLANNLNVPFYDLDHEIETRSCCSIPEIFMREGEASFRRFEKETLNRFLNESSDLILALGGGALLDMGSRDAAEQCGTIILLTSSPEELARRLENSTVKRPLLAGRPAERLDELLQSRVDHYRSFPLQIDTDQRSIHECAWQIQISIGRFYVKDARAGYPVLMQSGSINEIGNLLKHFGLTGPVAFVSDEIAASLWAHQAVKAIESAGFQVRLVSLPVGEKIKNLDTISKLWDEFGDSRLDRKATVVALGGGVVSDLAGFAAATFLRGISWVAVPSTLLGMVDASIGGKTGIDLTKGKNLAGAFHSPRLVLAFPELLGSLPDVEMRNGLAEVVKNALIGDPVLFDLCSRGWDALARLPKMGKEWQSLISRAMAVKIQIVEQDPYEQGRRTVLNLGHTLGHALEQASGYQLRHGEAVAIGLSAESFIGEMLGVTTKGLSERIFSVLAGLGLPTKFPVGINRTVLRQALFVDKKRQGSRIKLPLPVTVGEVIEKEIEEEDLWTLFSSYMDQT